MCSPELTREKFENTVQPGAKVGFKVLDQKTYEEVQRLRSGLYNFASADVKVEAFEPNADICMAATGDLNVESGPANNQSATVQMLGGGLVSLSGYLKVNGLAAGRNGVALGGRQKPESVRPSNSTAPAPALAKTTIEPTSGGFTAINADIDTGWHDEL
jgi:hypothetical protein